MKFLTFGGNILCVTLFDDPVREYLIGIIFDDKDREDSREPIFMLDEKYLCF